VSHTEKETSKRSSFQIANSSVKEGEVSMLDIRQVVVIVLFLINGLW